MKGTYIDLNVEERFEIINLCREERLQLQTEARMEEDKVKREVCLRRSDRLSKIIGKMIIDK